MRRWCFKRMMFLFRSVWAQVDEGGGCGKIFYQPDDADDFDEEDPDDDLDI